MSKGAFMLPLSKLSKCHLAERKWDHSVTRGILCQRIVTIRVYMGKLNKNRFMLNRVEKFIEMQ